MNAQTIDKYTLMSNLEALRAAAKAQYEEKMAKYDDTEAVIDEMFKTASNGAANSKNGSNALSLKAFSDMTILQATKSYLEYCNNKPQTSNEIATALKRHGIRSSSKKFLNTLRTILYKYTKHSNEIVRVNGKKWKLGGRRTK